MKRTKQILATIISLIILNFFVDSAHAQVWEGDYTITDSADIAALSGYTEVTGTLTIENTSLTSLTGLENITTVGGNLYIEFNDSLTNLCALYNVNLGEGILVISSNNVLSMNTAYVFQTQLRYNGFTGYDLIWGNLGTEQVFCDNGPDTIYGYVSGDVKEGIDVNIYILDCGAIQPHKTVTTDAQGYYTIGDLSNGRYLLVPNASGYTFSRSKWVDIPPRGIQSYDFTAIDNSYENTINLSVIGEGYFMVRDVEGNEGINYTRSSSFSLNQENLLANPQGYVLQGWALDPTSGERIRAIENIRLPEQSLIGTVSRNGLIWVKLVDGTILPVYQIALAMFEYPENLQDEGNGLYSHTEESGGPVTATAGIPFGFNERFFGTIEAEIF